jgi:N-acetyl-anhydromuramyl-L-alanine amidase AmpD
VPSAVPGPAPSGPAGSTGSEEPSLLQPVAPGSGPSSGGASGGNPQAAPGVSVPRLQPPGTSQTFRRRTVSTSLDRASLREQLIPYTNNPDDLFAPPKADRPWKYVVLHHSATAAGSYGAIDQEHRKRLGWEGCGYHFVIGNGTGSPDGQIEVSQRWSDQKHGIHCRNGKNPDVSEYGIGICLVGNLDDTPPTPRQIAAAQRLVTYLGARYRIPADHIGTHAQLSSSPTACPGKYFPTQAVLGATSNLVQR